MFFIDNLLRNKHFIYMKILVKFNFSLKIFSKMNTFHWKNCTSSVLHGELESKSKISTQPISNYYGDTEKVITL